MSKCTAINDVLSLCSHPKPLFDKPLPWHELKTQIKDFFILDKNHPACLIDTTYITEEQQKDIDKIYYFALSNKLYFTEQWRYPDFIADNLPSRFLFVSVYDFTIDEIRGDIYLKIEGKPKYFLGPQEEYYLQGLS